MAQDLLDDRKGDLPTPPPDHDPAPGHVARDWHAEATGEESIEAFSKQPDWTERTQAFETGGEEVEVFDPEEHDAPEDPPTVDSPEVELTDEPPATEAAESDGELVRDELVPRVEQDDGDEENVITNDRDADGVPQNGGGESYGGQ